MILFPDPKEFINGDGAPQNGYSGTALGDITDGAVYADPNGFWYMKQKTSSGDLPAPDAGSCWVTQLNGPDTGRVYQRNASYGFVVLPNSQLVV